MLRDFSLGAVKHLLRCVVLCMAVSPLSACGPLQPAQPSSLAWQDRNAGLTPHVSVTSLAIHPQNPQRMFAGVYAREALYASDDGGATWQAAGAALGGHAVFTLLVDPKRPEALWAGTADGLYRGSLDDSRLDADWQRVAEWPLARAVFALHAAPDGTLYAAGALPAVWFMAAGQPWQPLAPLPGDVGAVLAVATAAEGMLLAGSDGDGLFTSRDGGGIWQRAAAIGETYVAALWVAPWDDRLILARTRAGLFRSTDGAATWQVVGAELDGRVDAIAGIATEQAIYLGMSTGQLYRSADLGATWQGWGDGVGRDGMFNTLVAVPWPAQTFFAGTQRGLYRSQDRARTWQPITATVGTFHATALAQAPDGALYLGNEDGVWLSRDQGATWQPRQVGLPPRAVLAIVIAPDDPQVLYAATEGDGVYTSPDAGSHWIQLAWDNFIIPDLARDPHYLNRFYVRVAYERIYQSDDGGITWTARWDGMATTTEIAAFVLSPHQAGLLYAGGTVEAFKSEDGAAHWQPIGAELAGQSVLFLAVDAHDPVTVYTGATKGLYRSQDGGATWYLWGNGLADLTVTALAFHPTQPNQIYAGTKYRGVYASHDGGQSWQPAHNGMGELSVRQLLVDTSGRWLYAATDQGFWRAAIDTSAP
jgi:photosystem II stability/assembly factor-like uncharacterized protein